MGLTSWFAWLGEEIEDLKLVLSMTKDEEQRKILEKVISRMEEKAEKSGKIMKQSALKRE